MNSQKDQRLVLKIFLKNASITLTASDSTRNLVSDYLLARMKDNTLCVFKDAKGDINSVCRGEEVIGFSFEKPNNINAKYLSAATRYFELSARQIEDSVQADSWKTGDSES